MAEIEENLELVSITTIETHTIKTGELIKSITRRFRFHPKNQKDVEKIMEGNYPEKYGMFQALFTTFSGGCNTEIIGRTLWNYNKKDPFIEFTTETK